MHWNEGKTHCIRGHEFTAENTHIRATKGKDNGKRTCRACMKAVSRRHTLAKAGWTIEAFDRAFIDQKGKCAVCKEPLGEDRVCVDHEHTDPPKPRGILCNSCNAGIGFLKENPAIMKSAIKYLKKYR